MSCPVEILHSGIVLSPLTLFTLLTSITTHTQVHPLVFRYEEFDFLLDFYPSLNIFPPEEIENRTRYSSSFCHFQGADQHRTKAWLSVCDTKEIVLNLHIPLASFVLKESNGTFRFETREPENCDRLWAPLSKRDAEEYVYAYTKAQFSHYSMNYEHYFTRRRFIELAMFGDYSLYQKHGDRTQQHMLSIVHAASSYYDSLNIELRVIHMHIIDSAIESQNAQFQFQNDEVAMMSFQAFLKRDFEYLHYDHAVLFHAITVLNNKRTQLILGVANIDTMCYAKELSISWFTDTNDASEVGITFAHELGHGLGMEHDNVKASGRNCECPEKVCLMFPNSTKEKMQYWSSCSLEYLHRKFVYEGDYCMWNDPGYPVASGSYALGSPSCGNGVLDEGEDCDCGALGCLTHDCCDQKTCRFRGNAKCAIGPCCDIQTCSLRSGHLCSPSRAAKSSCDLPEICAKDSNECPPDEYFRDGSACPDDDEAICYSGRCTSRNLQCKLIWGNASFAAKKECSSVERAYKGYCDPTAEACRTDDLYCREIFCQGHEETYIMTGLNSYSFRINDSECTGDFVSVQYREGIEPEHRMGNAPAGAVCSYGKHCLKGECVSKTELFGCDYFQFFGGSEPSSCSSENECENPNWDNSTLKMTCNSGFRLQAELDDRSWLDVSRVECPNGKFEMYAKEQLLTVAPVRFRCIRNRIGHFDSQGSAKLGALSYVAIFSSIPIVIVIIVVIVLKATGRGWIHTIILEKIRGGKGRGKKTIKSQKKMSTKSQESTKTTIKESAKASQSPL